MPKGKYTLPKKYKIKLQRSLDNGNEKTTVGRKTNKDKSE